MQVRPVFYTTAYRYPNEQIILILTLFLVLSVIAVSAAVTLCGSGLFVLVMLIVTYQATQAHHQALLQQALAVTPETAPDLDRLARQCAVTLQPGPVEIFVIPRPVLNAYTLGLSGPKSIVLFSGLFERMDADELRFILGHEMGHVCLGHTWLNTLIGGMAGIPSPFAAAVILAVVFRWWNRAWEFSADRAGLLACGQPAKAVSALVKLAAGPLVATPQDLDRLAQALETGNENAAEMLSEALSTHPAIRNRIREIRRYAASAQYRDLQARVNLNAG